MKNMLLLIAALFFLTSCATPLLQSYYDELEISPSVEVLLLPILTEDGFPEDKILQDAFLLLGCCQEFYERDAFEKSLKCSDDAIAKISKSSIKNSPTEVYAYYLRGSSRDRLNDGDGAISDYTRVIQSSTLKNLDYKYNSYLCRGLWYLEQEQDQKAISDLTNAISIYPKSETPYIARAFAKRDLQDLAGAMKDANDALAINPKNAYAIYIRGWISLAQGNKESGCSDLAKASSMGDAAAKEEYPILCK